MELGQRFLTRTDERLLAVIHTLQQRTYKMGLPASSPVVEAFRRELAGVCKACGAREGGGGAQGRIGQYQLQFARDLDPASPSSPQTLGEMTERLKVGGARVGWQLGLMWGASAQSARGACAGPQGGGGWEAVWQHQPGANTRSFPLPVSVPSDEWLDE